MHTYEISLVSVRQSSQNLIKRQCKRVLKTLADIQNCLLQSLNLYNKKYLLKFIYYF